MAQTLNNALLIRPRAAADHRAQLFARGLAPDGQHNLVVLDLPADPPSDLLESLARILERRRGTFRMIPGRSSRTQTARLAQWLADRLDRAVLAPDGHQLAAAGGALFIPSGNGRGWLRYQPGRPALPDSQRFPRPDWEFFVPGAPVAIGPVGIAEPIPGGVWLRPGNDNGLEVPRQVLADRIVADPDLAAVVLGVPGGPALSLTDIAAFWRTRPSTGRRQMLFVPYGPVDVPHGTVLGRALAELLDHEIVLCNGFPAVGDAGGVPEVHTLGADGQLGWRPYAGELAYTPGGAAPVPRRARSPLPGLQPLGRGAYRYAPDAVVEIVQSGLWVRPPEDPPGADTVRAAPADPAHAAVLFDESTPSIATRLRALAHEILERLPLAERLRSVVLPAGYAIGAARRPGGRSIVLSASPAEPAPAMAWPGSVPYANVLPRAVEELAVLPRRVPGAGKHPGKDLGVQDTPRAGLGAEAGSGPGEFPSGAAASGVAPDPSVTRPSPVDPGRAHGGQDTAAPPGTARTGETEHTDADAASNRALPPGMAVRGPAGPATTSGTDGDAQATAGPYEDGTASGPVPPDPSAGEPVPDADPASAASRPAPAGDVPAAHAPAATAAAEHAPPAGAADKRNPAGSGSPAASGRPGGPRPGPALGIRLESAPSAVPAAHAVERPAQTAGDDHHAPAAGSALIGSPDRAPASAAPEIPVGDSVPATTPAPVPGVRVQPVPMPGARIALAPAQDLDRERSWLRRAGGARYEEAAGFVTRVMSQNPGLRGVSKETAKTALNDLTAVRLYLSAGPSEQVDDAVRGAGIGPHVPLARCVAAGLQRLPSYRGVALLRATLSDAELAWYEEAARQGGPVTEWGFCSALITARPGLPGDTDILLWSLTARRTALLQPELPDRVIFLPGTAFKALRVTGGEGRRVVLLRELTEPERAAASDSPAERSTLDDLATTGLESADEAVRAAAGDGRRAQPVPEAFTTAFTNPPGLIVPAFPHAPAIPTQQALQGEETPR
ncbi:MAG: hypothetical protein JF597_03550 [Streptomyces sp.]|uniref:hypothetical protein n=1 Tax=Streptomyces sp. TaxID=1931 RepID=UPI0025F82404|nr:hypothetical protein [Streptomyces sp.]MBW8792679.1 hypothetical protein [Streptomyces sp.]